MTVLYIVSVLQVLVLVEIINNTTKLIANSRNYHQNDVSISYFIEIEF